MATYAVVFELTVDDGFDGRATDAVTVFVQNLNDPPACHAALPSKPLLWPPTHKLHIVAIVGVTDPNKDWVTITITTATQDEPVSGLGDGDTSPDAVLQGYYTFLRAERSELGNGRVYQVHFAADDGTGWRSTGAVAVCVPQVEGNGCVDDGQRYDSTEP